MHKLIKVDYLFFGFVIITSVLLVSSWSQTENALSLLLTRGIIVSISVAFIFFNSILKSAFLHLLRNIYPVLFAGYFYTETVHYNKLFFNNLDQIFIDLDQWLFGFQPSIQFSEYINNSWFTELMYFAYFSFYFIILGFVIAMLFKRKVLFIESIFKVTFSLLFFYFIFAIFPSAGPQFYFDLPNKSAPTNGYIFQEIMHIIQENAEQPTGAFPSSHVGVTIVILLLARKKLPLFFNISLPLSILLVLSTVYIKAHYAVDAIFGLLIAPIVVYLATLVYNFPFKKEPIK
ncbi:MAG: phosphatase PAP2 family protein [Flavobacteriaceae bacterium]|nr:phosphatase PAP2 family protein [Flavobacteriaceae bacterium]